MRGPSSTKSRLIQSILVKASSADLKQPLFELLQRLSESSLAVIASLPIRFITSDTAISGTHDIRIDPSYLTPLRIVRSFMFDPDNLKLRPIDDTDLLHTTAKQRVNPHQSTLQGMLSALSNVASNTTIQTYLPDIAHGLEFDCPGVDSIIVFSRSSMIGNTPAHDISINMPGNAACTLEPLETVPYQAWSYFMHNYLCDNLDQKPLLETQHIQSNTPTINFKLAMEAELHGCKTSFTNRTITTTLPLPSRSILPTESWNSHASDMAKRLLSQPLIITLLMQFVDQIASNIAKRSQSKALSAFFHLSRWLLSGILLIITPIQTAILSITANMLLKTIFQGLFTPRKSDRTAYSPACTQALTTASQLVSFLLGFVLLSIDTESDIDLSESLIAGLTQYLYLAIAENAGRYMANLTTALHYNEPRPHYRYPNEMTSLYWFAGLGLNATVSAVNAASHQLSGLVTKAQTTHSPQIAALLDEHSTHTTIEQNGKTDHIEPSLQPNVLTKRPRKRKKKKSTTGNPETAPLTSPVTAIYTPVPTQTSEPNTPPYRRRANRGCSVHASSQSRYDRTRLGPHYQSLDYLDLITHHSTHHTLRRTKSLLNIAIPPSRHLLRKVEDPISTYMHQAQTTLQQDHVYFSEIGNDDPVVLPVSNWQKNPDLNHLTKQLRLLNANFIITGGLALRIAEYLIGRTANITIHHSDVDILVDTKTYHKLETDFNKAIIHRGEYRVESPHSSIKKSSFTLRFEGLPPIDVCTYMTPAIQDTSLAVMAQQMKVESHYRHCDLKSLGVRLAESDSAPLHLFFPRKTSLNELMSRTINLHPESRTIRPDWWLMAIEMITDGRFTLKNNYADALSHSGRLLTHLNGMRRFTLLYRYFSRHGGAYLQRLSQQMTTLIRRDRSEQTLSIAQCLFPTIQPGALADIIDALTAIQPIIHANDHGIAKVGMPFYLLTIWAPSICSDVKNWIESNHAYRNINQLSQCIYRSILNHYSGFRIFIDSKRIEQTQDQSLKHELSLYARSGVLMHNVILTLIYPEATSLSALNHEGKHLEPVVAFIKNINHLINRIAKDIRSAIDQKEQAKSIQHAPTRQHSQQNRGCISQSHSVQAHATNPYALYHHPHHHMPARGVTAHVGTFIDKNTA